jgi:tetratricopeptide (TPR) repeat protein
VSLDGIDPTAVEEIEEARAEVLKSPRSAAAWSKLGMIYFAFGYAKEAGFCLHWAGVRDPKEPRWPYLEALTALDKPDRCMPLLARAVELAPNEPVFHLRYGEMLLEQGRLDDAEIECTRILDREPEDPRALHVLGRVCYQRGNLVVARGHLEHAAELAPRVRATHALLVEIYSRQNDTAAAERAQSRMAGLPDGRPWLDTYEEEVDQFQVGVQARIDRADALFREGQTDMAVSVLGQYVKNHPDCFAAQAALGRFLVLQGNFVAAEQVLHEAVRLNPDSVKTQCDYGSMLQRRGEYGDASQCFRKAIKSKPTHARAHYQLADCLWHLGNKPEAAQSYRDAIRYKPDFADAHRDLGRLLAETGDTAEARKELDHAVRLAPSDELARKQLELLPAKP